VTLKVISEKYLGEESARLRFVPARYLGDDPFAPFGGVGASGNGARHGGPANWEEFTQWQWVTLQARPPRYQF
jgi:benzaldehyde dehydrogenase (NAD)